MFKIVKIQWKIEYISRQIVRIQENFEFIKFTILGKLNVKFYTLAVQKFLIREKIRIG